MSANKEMYPKLDINHVKSLLFSDLPILSAIKYIKSVTGVSITECRQILEDICNELPKEEKIRNAAPELLYSLTEVMNIIDSLLSNNATYQLSKTSAEEGSNNWYSRAMAAIEKATK